MPLGKDGGCTWSWEEFQAFLWKLVETKSKDVSKTTSSSEVSKSFSLETLSGDLEEWSVLWSWSWSWSCSPPEVLLVRLLLKSVWYMESPLLEPSLTSSFLPPAVMSSIMSAASEFNRICRCRGSSSTMQLLVLLFMLLATLALLLQIFWSRNSQLEESTWGET